MEPSIDDPSLLDPEQADLLRWLARSMLDRLGHDTGIDLGYQGYYNVPSILKSTGYILSAPATRALAWHCRLFRMVLLAPSTIIEASQGVRIATPAMRGHIEAAYDTCGYDQCPIPAHMCELDHILSWRYGHRTRVEELMPACGYHNRDRARHPDKYRLERHPDGRYHFRTNTTWRN